MCTDAPRSQTRAWRRREQGGRCRLTDLKGLPSDPSPHALRGAWDLRNRQTLPQNGERPANSQKAALEAVNTLSLLAVTAYPDQGRETCFQLEIC